MAKYIRTNKGRIIDTNKVCVGNKETDFRSLEHYFEVLKDCGEDIINQADTIEELCDEFVAYHKTLKLTYRIQKIPFKENNENFNIYGAIWTDKGLIYVAKMNEKGELELL